MEKGTRSFGVDIFFPFFLSSHVLLFSGFFILFFISTLQHTKVLHPIFSSCCKLISPPSHQLHNLSSTKPFISLIPLSHFDTLLSLHNKKNSSSLLEHYKKKVTTLQYLFLQDHLPRIQLPLSFTLHLPSQPNTKHHRTHTTSTHNSLHLKLPLFHFKKRPYKLK